MSLVVDEHRQYLSDEIRVAAFRRAIAGVVRPGDVVLDLASGTGVLGLLACEAGAARVYSVEMDGMIEIARAAAVANGFADRMIFVPGLSSHVSLPEPVDAIVCDQIGHFGIEAGLVQFCSDARDRFLKPGGAMVPAGVELWLAPVESADLYGQVQVWTRRPAGFDFSAARAWAVNTGYPTTLPAEALLGAPAAGVRLDLSRVTPAPFAFDAELAAARPGTLHGIGGFFSATLAPGVTLSNSPLAECRVNRRNVFFPVERPIALDAGDRIHVHMRIRPAETMIGWTVEVVGADGARKARSRHSTLAGMLLSREDLRRTDPRFVPRLTPCGVARSSVLALCDGVRPLAEIEREVYSRHPDLFASPAEAAEFVAEVVTRYSI
jgi:Arginine methyltransferase oligomerization subdomain/Ribosomal protein L11 methyltransferase (PrmA)